MAAPETQFQSAGLNAPYVYTPVEGKYSNPMTLQPVNYDALQNALQNATTAVTQSAINPAVRAEMQAKMTGAQKAQSLLSDTDPWRMGVKDGQTYVVSGPESGKAYADVKGPNLLGTQPYDPAKDPRNQNKGSSAPAAPSGQPVAPLTNSDPNNPTPLGSGNIYNPPAAAAPATTTNQPATTTNQPATTSNPSTAEPVESTPLPAQSSTDQPQLNLASGQPAQTGNMFAANTAAPPPAAPAAQPVQQPDQGAISTALAQTRVPSQGGNVEDKAASTDNTFAMKQWQQNQAHPPIPPKQALDFVRSNLDTRAQDATYMPHGGPNGEPAYAFHMKGGGMNVVPLSQLVANGAAPLAAGNNTSMVLSASDAVRKQNEAMLGNGANPALTPPPDQTGAQPSMQPPPAQPPPPGGQMSDADMQTQLAAAGNVPSKGGPDPQYLSAQVRGANVPPAPPAPDAAHPYHEPAPVPYPHPTTQSEADTNRQVATGKVDRNGVATIGNAGNDSVNLTGQDGMLHYTGMSTAQVQAMADKAKASGFNMGTRENGDPYLGMSPSGRNYFMSDGGNSATSRPYTAEPGDSPFTEHRLYAGSDNWRDVTPEENQLKANLAEWDKSLPVDQIKAMQTPELVARLRDLVYQQQHPGTVSKQTVDQLSDLQSQLQYAHRMQNVMATMPDNNITQAAIESNRGAGAAQGQQGAKGFGDKIVNAAGAFVNRLMHGNQVDDKITYLDTNARALSENASKYNLGQEMPQFNMGPDATRTQLASFIKNREIDYQRILNASLGNKEKVDRQMLDYGNNLIQGKPNYDPGDRYANHPNTVATSSPTGTPAAVPTPSATPKPPGRPPAIIDRNNPNWQKMYDDLPSGAPYKYPNGVKTFTKG